MLRWLGHNRAAAALAQAEEAMAARQPEVAERHYQHVIRLGHAAGPELWRAHIGLGRVALSRSRLEAAKDEFSLARRLRPDEWEAIYWEGCAHGHAGRFDEADELFTKALALSADRPTVRRQRGLARFKLGRFCDAFRDFSAVSESVGAGTWLALAAELETVGDLASALSAYQHAGQDAQAAIVSCKLGDYERACVVLTPMARTADATDSILLHHGWAALSTDRLEDAVQSWTRLAQRRGSESELRLALARANYNLGLRYIRQGNHGRALTLWRESHAECRVPDASALAELYFHVAADAISDRQAAQRALTSANTAVPDDYRFPYHLGLLLVKQGRWEEAVASLEAALRNAPDNAGVIRALAITSARSGDVRRLEALRRRLQNVAPASSAVVDHALALTYLERREPQRVLSLLRDSPVLGSAHPEIVACAMFGARRFDELVPASGDGATDAYRALATIMIEVSSREVRSLLSTEWASGRDLTPLATKLQAYLQAARGSLDAAGKLFGGGPSSESNIQTGLLDALLLLAAGQRLDGIARLSGVLRSNLSDDRILHALAVASYHGALAAPDNVSADLYWKHAIAAWVALFHHLPFWHRLSSRTSSLLDRDGRPPRGIQRQREIVDDVRRLLDKSMAGVEAPAMRHSLQLEIEAAALLEQCGGLPISSTEAIVVGPLFGRLFGLTDSIARFFSGLDASVNTSSTALAGLKKLLDEIAVEPTGISERALRQQRLTHYFSSLGVAQLHLERGSPEAAIEALGEAWCGHCEPFRLRLGGYTGLPVCGGGCDSFFTSNPSFIGRDPSAALAGAAARLAVQAHLRIAHEAVAADRDLATATAAWGAAKELAVLVGARDEVEGSIAATALGRARNLERKDNLDAARRLLEAALTVCSGPAARDLIGRMAEILTDQGVAEGNRGNWVEAVSLLRRAMEANPHVFRPVLNFARAQVAVADRHCQDERYLEAQAKLEEGLEVLERVRQQFATRKEFETTFDEVRHALGKTYNDHAIATANRGDLDRALELLSLATVKLPGDAGIVTNRNRVLCARVVELLDANRRAEARQLVTRGLRDCGDDESVVDELKKYGRLLSLLERGR